MAKKELTPEQLAKRKKTNKTVLIVAGVLLLLFIIIGVSGSDDKTTQPANSDVQDVQAETPLTDEARQLINAEIDYYDGVILTATQLSQVTDEDLLKPNGLLELNEAGTKLYAEANTRVTSHSDGLPKSVVNILSEMSFYSAEAAMTAGMRQLDKFNQNVKDYATQKELLLNLMAQ